MNKSKDYTFFVLFLWIGLFAIVAAIAYLSFQGGEAAKALGTDLIGGAASRYYGTKELTETQYNAMAYVIRQSGRIIAFFVMGVWCSITIHATFHRLNWVIRTIIIVLFLLVVAVLTERLKIYIPTRHYSKEEMMLSIYGALGGAAIVSIVTFVYSLVKFLLGLFIKEK